MSTTSAQPAPRSCVPLARRPDNPDLSGQVAKVTTLWPGPGRVPPVGWSRCRARPPGRQAPDVHAGDRDERAGAHRPVASLRGRTTLYWPTWNLGTAHESHQPTALARRLVMADIRISG